MISEAMQIMRQDWKPGMKLQEALELTAKVLVKTMDTASPTAERLEFGVVYKTPEGQVPLGSPMVFFMFSQSA